jgi:hypothetical protein
MKQQPVAQEEKAGCLGGLWKNMQARVEEINREAERREKKRG